MKRIQIIGLDAGKSESREFSVLVLGNKARGDSLSSDAPRAVECIGAVSPDGAWVALSREGWCDDRRELSLVDVAHPEAEIYVPLDPAWCWPRIRDLNSQGVLLAQVELDQFEDASRSRRPILFDPKGEKMQILPPAFKRSRWGSEERMKEPGGHTPHCFAGDGSISGWAHCSMQEILKDRSDRGTLWCSWKKSLLGRWQVEYLPETLRQLWVWPGPNGALVWNETESKSRPARFGFYDGHTMSTWPLSLEGTGIKVISVASDFTLSGHLCSKGARGEGYCFLAQPGRAEGAMLLKHPERQLWLAGMCRSGRYLVGTIASRESRKQTESALEGRGVFLLEARDQEYHYYEVLSPGWRLSEPAAVTDTGTVFCLGVCVDPKSAWFRLKMPLSLQVVS